jgi:hypothetical protein
MLYRTLSLSLAVALALFVVTSASARPDKEGTTHTGKFVSAKGTNQFVMIDKDGKTEHTHTLASNAAITCDGKNCKLSDLKAGTALRVTVEEKDGKKIVTKVEGSTRGAGSGR